MKPAVYLTNPDEMRKARLNQPRVSSEQLRAQLEAFRQVSAKPAAEGKTVTSSRGRVKAAA